MESVRGKLRRGKATASALKARRLHRAEGQARLTAGSVARPPHAAGII